VGPYNVLLAFGGQGQTKNKENKERKKEMRTQLTAKRKGLFKDHKLIKP
jgi:hypothetical protein